MSTSFYDEWRKQAQEYKPAKEISQRVLWLKQMGLMSEHYKAIDVGDKIITEPFLNQMMQLAYDEGCKAIDERSYEEGRESMWQEVLKKLGVDYEGGY